LDDIGREPVGSDPNAEPAETAPAVEPPVHDVTGLDLARSVADQFRGDGRRPTGDARPRHRPAGSAQFSGAHPDDRDPATLSATVDRLVSESGWSTQVSVHSVLGRWPHIVGLEVARHCTPESYLDTVLTVAADSTAWATQLTLLAATVVARLNAELGDGTVTRIQVRGPGGPNWRKGRLSVRDGRGPRDTYG
jgi:predicted nucleic acid-binding Zn ribbon protein